MPEASSEPAEPAPADQPMPADKPVPADQPATAEPAPPPAPEPRRFEYEFQKRYRPMLAAIGVRPANSFVTVSSEEMVARFGRWTCKSPVDNIKCVHLTGPYLAVKAIGTRMSAADTGLTFGTTTTGGVCVCFRRPMPGFDALGKLRHEALTVTVADREGFVAAIRAVATLDEEDEEDEEGQEGKPEGQAETPGSA